MSLSRYLKLNDITVLSLLVIYLVICALKYTSILDDAKVTYRKKQQVKKTEAFHEKIKADKHQIGLTWNTIMCRYFRSHEWKSEPYSHYAIITCSGVERRKRACSVEIEFQADLNLDTYEIVSVRFENKERIGKGKDIFIRNIAKYAEEHPAAESNTTEVKKDTVR